MTRNKGRSSLKRTAILCAAIDEFGENGFLGASMDRIAALADVSKRTVYNHFPSKEDLFMAIVEQMMVQIKEAAHIQYDPDRSIDQQLLQLAKQEIELLTSEGFLQLAKIGIAEAFHSPERVQQAMASINVGENHFIQWLRKVSDLGLMTIDDVDLAAEQFFGLIKASAFWPAMIKGQQPLGNQGQEQVARETVAMFLARYGEDGH